MSAASGTQFNNIANILITYPNKSARTMVDSKLTEDNLMASLFSSSFSVSQVYSGYFLKNEYANVYTNLSERNIFFDFEMKKITTSGRPEMYKNIVDLDISMYNKQNIIKYYFLLDLLSEFYGYLSNVGISNTNNVIRVKSRYYIDEGEWKLYRKADYFTFYVSYSYNSSDEARFMITKVDNESIDMVKNMCLEFQPDILRHLDYIRKADVSSGNREYLHNIQAFYKFCRLKLIYYTLLCCAEIEKSVNDFIQKQLSYCFINLKNYIMLNNVENQSIMTTNQLMISTQKLKEINQTIEKKRDNIKKNEKKSAYLKDNYWKELLYLTIGITIVMFFVMLILYGSGLLKEGGKWVSDIVVLTIAIGVYLFVNYYISSTLKETFVSYPTFTNESTNLKYWWKFDNNLKDSIQQAEFRINDAVDGMNEPIYEIKDDMNTMKLQTAVKYPDETTFKLTTRVTMTSDFTISFWCNASACCNKIMTIGPDIYFSIVKDVRSYSNNNRMVFYVNPISENRQYTKDPTTKNSTYYGSYRSCDYVTMCGADFQHSDCFYNSINQNGENTSCIHASVSNVLPMTFNKFMHYTLTYNNTTKLFKFYVNSELQYEKTYTFTSPTSPITLGLFNNGGSSTQISYADLRIYNKPLIYQEIYTLWNKELYNSMQSNDYVYPITTYPQKDSILVKDSNNIEYYLLFNEPDKEYIVTVAKDIVCDIIMVGGGGGGDCQGKIRFQNMDAFDYPGGGGGGGIVQVSKYTLPAGTYKFIVGKGGDCGSDGNNTIITRSGWGTVSAPGGGKAGGNGKIVTTNSSLNFPNSSGGGGGGNTTYNWRYSKEYYGSFDYQYSYVQYYGYNRSAGGSGNSLASDGASAKYVELSKKEIPENEFYSKGGAGMPLIDNDVGKGLVSNIISKTVPLYIGFGGNYDIPSNVDPKNIIGKGGDTAKYSYEYINYAKYTLISNINGTNGAIILKYTLVEENVISFSVPVNVVNNNSVQPVKLPYNSAVTNYIMTDDTYVMTFTTGSYIVNITRDTLFDILMVGGGGSGNYVYNANSTNVQNGSPGEIIEKKSHELKAGSYIFNIGVGGTTNIIPSTGTPTTNIIQATSTTITLTDGTELFNAKPGTKGGNGNQTQPGSTLGITGESKVYGGNAGIYGKGGKGNTQTAYNHEYGVSGVIILRFSAYILRYNDLVSKQETIVANAQSAAQEASRLAEEKGRVAQETDDKLKALQAQLDQLNSNLVNSTTNANPVDTGAITAQIATLQSEITRLSGIKDQAERDIQSYDVQAKQQTLLKEAALLDKLQLEADIQNYVDLLQQVKDTAATDASNATKQSELDELIRLAGNKIATSADASLISKEREIIHTLSLRVAEKQRLLEEYRKNTEDAKKAFDAINLSTKNISDTEKELAKAKLDAAQIAEATAAKEATITEAQIAADAKQEIADARKKTYDDLKKELDDLAARMTDTSKIQAITESIAIQKSIDSINKDTSQFLNNADAQYAALAQQRNTEISNQQALITAINRTMQLVNDEIKQHVADTTRDRNASIDLYVELRKVTEEILMYQMNLLQYKYISKVLSMDNSVANISTKITLNINNTAVAIANSIVLTSIHKELIEYENQKDMMTTIEHKSQHDIAIKERDNKIMIETTKFIANILLATSIVTVLYTRGSFSSVYLLYILLVVYIALIIFYMIEIIRIVRTKAKNFYWRKPKTRFD